MSYKIKLEDSRVNELKQALKREGNIKIYNRLMAVYMLYKGIMKKDIADLLNVTQNTITTWIKIYLQGGVKDLSQLHYEGRRESKLDPYKGNIEEFVKTNHPVTVSQIQSWLLANHSLDVEHSWLYRYCKENSIIPVN